MSDLNKAILKVAQTNPEFRKALVAELKQARGLNERQIFSALLADFKTGMEGEPDASTQAAMPGVLAASERKIGAILKGMQKKLPPGANWARQPVFHTLAEEIAEYALHLGWLHSPPAGSKVAKTAELKKEANASAPIVRVLQTAWERGAKDGDGSNMGDGWDAVKRIDRLSNELMSRSPGRYPPQTVDALSRSLVELLYSAGFNSKSF